MAGRGTDSAAYVTSADSVRIRAAGLAVPESVARPQLFDASVLLIVGCLMTLGAAMVYSTSVSVTSEPFNWRKWLDTPLRQVLFAGIGFFGMLAAARVDYRSLAWERARDWWRPGLPWLLAAVLLVAVLVPGIGHHAMGARRALPVPGIGISFQPSELAKVALVIWTAAWLARSYAERRETGGREPRKSGTTRDGYPVLQYAGTNDRPTGLGDVRDFRTGFVPLVLTAGVLIGLTGIEDFGTAGLLGGVFFLLLLAGGARPLHLGLLVLAGIGAAAGLIAMAPYRLARIQAYIDGLMGNADPRGAGYQVNQALLAIGSGGWWGRGLGAGVQKYGYLPQDNNDFILAIICEELGAAGGLVVVGLFLLLLYRGWRIATRAPDRFGRLLALGLTLTICLQAAFNIGVVTNSVPTKGISLPFVSAGGSGVVFLGLAAGLLAAVGRERGSRC